MRRCLDQSILNCARQISSYFYRANGGSGFADFRAQLASQSGRRLVRTERSIVRVLSRRIW